MIRVISAHEEGRHGFGRLHPNTGENGIRYATALLIARPNIVDDLRRRRDVVDGYELVIGGVEELAGGDKTQQTRKRKRQPRLQII